MKTALIKRATLAAALAAGIAAWGGQRPGNDEYANPKLISGKRGSVACSTVGATSSEGEILQDLYASSATVWFRWIAPCSGGVRFDTSGSSFDTVIGVLKVLDDDFAVSVTANDDAGDGVTSTVAFAITEGCAYMIAAGGCDDECGALRLKWAVIEDYGTPKFVVDDGCLSEVDLNGCVDLIVPDSVTSIGSSVLDYCSDLRSVTIPDSVTYIGSHAFGNCSGLTNVTMGASVTSIGNGAFEDCSGLTSVEIPDSVTTIGDYAFGYCSGLTNVTIGASVADIGHGAFRGCSALDGIVVSGGNLNYKFVNGLLLSMDGQTLVQGFNGDIVIPDGVTVIEASAFSYCSGLTSIEIPDSVTNIGESAFADCTGLKSVTIPAGVAGIGERAFCGCGALDEIVVSEGNANYKSVNGLLLSMDGRTLIQGVNGDITIPDGVTVIEYGAFEDCSGLTSIEIPDSVTAIGDFAFFHCTGLWNVAIPDSVERIGSRAFDFCDDTIYDTDSLPGVYLVDGWAVDRYVWSHGTLDLTDVRGIGDYAFFGCFDLTGVTIPNGVRRIGDGSFSACDSLTSVAIPDSVVEIGDHAFSSCSSLENIVIPASVTNIGVHAFYDCQSLTSLVFEGDAPVEELFFDSPDCTAYVHKGSSGWNTPIPGNWSGIRIKYIEDSMCTATFNANGGKFADASAASRLVGKNVRIGALPVPVRTGYKFAGWYTKKSGGTKISAKTKIAKSATFYAHWTARKWKVSAFADGSGSASGAKTYAYGSKVTMTAKPAKGWVFVKWEYLVDGDSSGFWPAYGRQFRQPKVTFAMPAGNVSVMAVFAKSSEDAAPAVSLDNPAPWHIGTDAERVVTVGVDSLSYAAASLTLPAGLKNGMKFAKVAGTDDKWTLKVVNRAKCLPGAYTLKVSAKNRAGKSGSATIKVYGPNTTTAVEKGALLVGEGISLASGKPNELFVGMKFDWADLGIKAAGGWTLSSVSGLPAGLAWNAKTRKVTGVCTKAGVFTTTFTVKKGKTAYKASATFVVRALPAEVVGTFKGWTSEDGETGEAGASSRSVTFTASSAGKLSAKIGSCSFAAAGWTKSPDGKYVATLTGKRTVGKGKSAKTYIDTLDVALDPDAGWNAIQLAGTVETVLAGGDVALNDDVLVFAQRNPFTSGDEAAVAAGAALAKPGVFNLSIEDAVDESGYCELFQWESGSVAARISVKSDGTAVFLGAFGGRTVCGSAVFSAGETGRFSALFFTSSFTIEVVFLLDESGQVEFVRGGVWSK